MYSQVAVVLPLLELTGILFGVVGGAAAVSYDVYLLPSLVSASNPFAFSSSSMRSCLSSSERYAREASETTMIATMKKEAILMPSGRSKMFATVV